MKVSTKLITKGIMNERVIPTQAESDSLETVATICKTESDSSFTIPSSLSYYLGRINSINRRIALLNLCDTSLRISIYELKEGVLALKSSITDYLLGGDVYDKAIVDWLVREYAHDNDGFDLKKDYSALYRLCEEAESATLTLLNFEKAEIDLPYITYDNGVPKHMVRTLTREKFKQLCDSLFRLTLVSCRIALSEANLLISDIDEVIIAGSSTFPPGLREKVKDFFGKDPTSLNNADEIDGFRTSNKVCDYVSDGDFCSGSQRGFVLSSLNSKQIINSSQSEKGDDSTSRKSTYSQEQIDALKEKVGPALSRFVRYKKYHRHVWTCELLSAETGINVGDLSDYFRYVESIDLHAWIDKLRIEEAKNSIQFFTDKTLWHYPNKIGFSSSQSFREAFIRLVGEQPDEWRTKQAHRIIAGDDTRPPKLRAVLMKVEAAFSQWVEAKCYLAPGLSPTEIAQSLQLSKTELFLYCDWILNNDIITKINDLRVEEAKKIFLQEPFLDMVSVANRVGYSSSSSLGDQFKKRTGLAPSGWKKKMLPDFKRVIVRSDPVAPTRIKFDDEEVIKWKRKKGYCQSNISLKSVARECGFSDARFSQYLRQEENATFNEWISKLRMEEAKRILINQSSLPTEQVGKRLGFSTKSGFITWFKQQTGYTPESWRVNVLSRKISKTDADVRSTVSVPFNVKKTVEEWIEGKGYCKSRLSLEVVANELGLTEDQLSTYFYNEGFNQFPVWISSLRIKEAQRLLITYPSMQIITVAARIGMTDVKIFRGIFKRLVGELPTDWRKKNSRRSVAEVMTGIEKRPSKPFSLDLEKLKDIESTTTQAQSILSDIFVDDDYEERKEANKKAEDTVMSLIGEILSKEKWLRSEFDKLCAARSIMPGFAIERINDIAFEKVDDILIDDAGDILYVNTDYKDMLV